MSQAGKAESAAGRERFDFSARDGGSGVQCEQEGWKLWYSYRTWRNLRDAFL